MGNFGENEGVHTIRCESCGAPLKVTMNCSRVVCEFCGAENAVDREQMKAKYSVYPGVEVGANTSIEGILNAVVYELNVGNANNADKLLVSAILSGSNDYRIYGYKTVVELKRGNTKSIVKCIKSLIQIRGKIDATKHDEFKRFIRGVMRIQGLCGMNALTSCIIEKSLEGVQFCVENGADKNGKFCGIYMYDLCNCNVFVDPNTGVYTMTKGAQDATSKKIKEYLKSQGAQRKRSIFNAVKSNGEPTIASVVLWMILFPPVGIYRLSKIKIDLREKVILTIVIYMAIVIAIFGVKYVWNGIEMTQSVGANGGEIAGRYTVENLYDMRDVYEGNYEELNGHRIILSGNVSKVKNGLSNDVVYIDNPSSKLEFVECNISDATGVAVGQEVEVNGICKISSLKIKLNNCKITILK